MTRAVILVENGFQDEEFVYPYYRMKEEGWEVSVVGPDGCKGKYGIPARSTSFDIHKALDVIVIPGGYECPDRLRMKPDVLNLVQDAFEAGKIIAAICHGPWVLISAGILKDRVCTAYPSLRDDLLNAGAKYNPVPVVTDGNIVTADHYRNNGEFMKAVIQAVNKKHEWRESPVVL